MAETRNVVILGASFGGLSAAHYLAKHVLPKLQASPQFKYVLHLVDPSTHFWWHIAAPRELVSIKEIPHSKAFVPIMDGFKQYTSLQDSIVFHHRAATALDTAARTVTLTPSEGVSDAPAETLSYYALVIATGIKSPTPCTTLHGDYTISQKALEEMNQKIAAAQEVVIGGGGPVGVETAGEIGSHLNGKAKITLIAGGDKILPVLSHKRATKAQKMLEKVGVTVKYGTKVSSTSQLPDGKTEITFDNGEALVADVYIDATGVKPNTDFLAAELKAPNGYVKTNHATLRVEGAGEKVYAAGDVAGADKGGVLNIYNSFPVLAANLSHDLLGSGAEKVYKYKEAETQIVPVGSKTGVGAFNGFGLPGFIVATAKGKDYLLKSMPDFTEGKKWVKA